MMTSNFDTLKATKNLTGKTLFNKKQAEKLVETVADSQSELVTKAHLSNEIKLAKSELKIEIEILRGEMKTGHESLRKDLYRVLFAMTGAIIASTSIIIAAIGILG